MGKVLLYYKYVHIEYPRRAMKWQRQICTDLNLTGRILLSNEGINGTVGGSDSSIKRYIQIMQQNPDFSDIDFKESDGGVESFNKLIVRVKDEIVHLGLDPQEYSANEGGTHLTPDEVHQLLSNKPENLVILDARNDYEWEVGAFQGAIKPPIKNFRDLPEYIDQNIEQFKDKEVLMYCTGGVRCERATTYLKKKGVSTKVYQILGGIHRYAEKYPDGFFRGKNYVFDNRIALRVNEDILGSCSLCKKPCDDYANCVNAECNQHFISCTHCIESYINCCSAECKELILARKVRIRPTFEETLTALLKSRE